MFKFYYDFEEKICHIHAVAFAIKYSLSEDDDCTYDRIC